MRVFFPIGLRKYERYGRYLPNLFRVRSLMLMHLICYNLVLRCRMSVPCNYEYVTAGSQAGLEINLHAGCRYFRRCSVLDAA